MVLLSPSVSLKRPRLEPILKGRAGFEGTFAQLSPSRSSPHRPFDDHGLERGRPVEDRGLRGELAHREQ